MSHLRTLFVAAVIAVSTGVASAEPMPAADVAGFLGAGKFTASAGSTFEFNGDGSFLIKHSNGRETGTYQVLADGSVSRMRDGAKKPDVFFIDIDAKGRKSLVYTAGQYKGKKFKLK